MMMITNDDVYDDQDYSIMVTIFLKFTFVSSGTDSLLREGREGLSFASSTCTVTTKDPVIGGTPLSVTRMPMLWAELDS
jgi:hypothetical protein